MASPPQQQQNPSESHDHESLMNSFMEITSSTAQEARFFLESHNFDLDSAVETFFDSTSTAIATARDSPSSPSASLSPNLSPSRSRSHSPPLVDSGARSQYNLRSRRPSSDNSGPTRSGRVRTFSDLNRSSAGDGDDSGDDSDSDRPNQYFTGGQKSGMLVQDPSKVDDVDAFFEQARRMGAMEGPADVFQPSSSARSFTGTARLLSGEAVPSASHERPPESVIHTITFWRNGFTVDDGPLRRFHDPENAAFLESIKRSECPKELQPADRRTSVNVNLVRKDENCPEPKKHKMPFQGVGRTLGNSSSAPSEPTSESTTPLNAAPTPVMGLVVDQNSPTTSIQLRLADGTRMVSRFNYHHTVQDIHAFIDASRPGRGGTYTLQTVGFPPKKLTDLQQTIEQAGLSNSVVIQKV